MEILIGKNDNCNYKINDDTISGNHCKIILQQNTNLYIIDLNSTNGTYVNRQKIPPNTMVNITPDSEIHLSGMFILDWKIIRELLPGINSMGRTTLVSPEEIERRMNSNNGGLYHSIPPGSGSEQKREQRTDYPPPPQQTASTGRSDLLYAAHAGKSYVGSAFLTWIMYYIGFFIIGFILNIIYLNQAAETKQIIGRSPSGHGCLEFLIFVHVVLPIILILMIIGGVIHFGSMLPDFLRF